MSGQSIKATRKTYGASKQLMPLEGSSCTKPPACSINIEPRREREREREEKRRERERSRYAVCHQKGGGTNSGDSWH